MQLFLEKILLKHCGETSDLRTFNTLYQLKINGNILKKTHSIKKTNLFIIKNKVEYKK